MFDEERFDCEIFGEKEQSLNFWLDVKNCVVILNKLNIYGGISPRLQPTHSPLRNTAIWPLFVGELPHKYKSISNTPVYCENLLKIR